LGLWISWDYGSDGFMARLGLWISWDYGSDGFMAQLGLWLGLVYGSEGLWLGWGYGSVGVMAQLGLWLGWGYGSDGVMARLGLGLSLGWGYGSDGVMARYGVSRAVTRTPYHTYAVVRVLKCVCKRGPKGAHCSGKGLLQWYLSSPVFVPMRRAEHVAACVCRRGGYLVQHAMHET
jgi:hypothetical protein